MPNSWLHKRFRLSIITYNSVREYNWNIIGVYRVHVYLLPKQKPVSNWWLLWGLDPCSVRFITYIWDRWYHCFGIDQTALLCCTNMLEWGICHPRTYSVIAIVLEGKRSILNMMFTTRPYNYCNTFTPRINSLEKFRGNAWLDVK